MNKKPFLIAGALVVGLVVIFIAMKITGEPYKPSGSASSVVGDDSSTVTTPENIDDDIQGLSSSLDPQETVEAFRRIDGRIQFPDSLRYPTSVDNPSATYINIGRNFRIAPSKNWITNVDGNTLNAVHTTGPSFIIKQTVVEDEISIDVVNEELSKFITSTGNEQGKANDIFNDGDVIGRLISCPITIDGDTLIMDAAIFECDREVYQLVCTYPPETEETVTALYNSLKYSDRDIVLK
ncbi:MAG: hypothetical protein RSC43_00160 [Clostridia bacterium]